MHNASNTQTAASTFNPSIVNISNLLATLCGTASNHCTLDIALLEAIGHMAFGMAQEARLQNASDEAVVDKMEQDLEDEDLAWESDAMDHGAEDRHIDGYWESLTDIGDMGGGDY